MINYLKGIHDMVWKLNYFYLFKIPDYLKKNHLLQKDIAINNRIP